MNMTLVDDFFIAGEVGGQEEVLFSMYQSPDTFYHCLPYLKPAKGHFRLAHTYFHF